LTAFGSFKILQAVAAADPTGSFGRLLHSDPVDLTVAAALSMLVWGILALGTASLGTGMLPRGSIVLWMTGLAASLLTSWLPVALVGMAGVVWSSLTLLRARKPNASSHSAGAASAAAESGRLLPLDALRGTIIALMAIDHASIFVRRWHPFETGISRCRTTPGWRRC
jgi:hypothetical protein